MKVLLIEDNAEIINGVALTFKLRWPEASVVSAMEGKKGLQMAKDENPDIVILDINLPDIDGFEVLKQMRLFSDVPVIILTVRGDEIDQLTGLEMGADDYILKPFSPANLLTRVKAVLRRTGTRKPHEAELTSMQLGSIEINFSTREVFLDKQRVHLTATEYKVLCCLAQNEGKVLSHEAIMHQVWGAEADNVDGGSLSSTLKRYIHQLRGKLGDNTDPPRLIFSERGMGYRLVKPPNAG